MRNCSVFLLILLSISVHARNADLGCDCDPDLPGSPGSFDDVAQIAGAVQSEELRSLSNGICRSLELNYGHEDAHLRIEDVFLRHLNINRNTPNYKNQIFELWNQNADSIICENSSLVKPHLRTPQQFMKRVIDMNMDGLVFNEFLLAPDDGQTVNVNAVQVVNGEEETVLDYIEGILEDSSQHEHYDINEIFRLRHHLVNNFGALNARDV
ncbi:MAG: hypothetical protein CME62_07470 [Halobacteriovoraceae bacterium]|nr:hypothetical protein [Halobacteriovoraceae bacterium]|tara:strand:+ start:18210 stop:18842 length:633 start_codon:yes stop_codon:yes gene_type:complete